jgi:hypothetical protein
MISRTTERFILLGTEEYDDSPLTSEELGALAWEAGMSLGWEEMDEYDDLPEVHEPR